MSTREAELLAVLSHQNPWWADEKARPPLTEPLRRPEFDEIERRLLDLASPRATLMVGPRRVGKTVLLHQVASELLDQGWPSGQVVLCDLEDPLFRNSPPTLGEVVDIHENRVGRDPDGPPVFLFDELQASQDWAAWLKKLIDHEAGRIVATDSAAALLETEGLESGGGRWRRLPIRCLSFPDFYRLRRVGGGTEGPSELDPRKAGPELDAYLTRGGFPVNLWEESLPRLYQDLRKDIAEIAIEKDLAVLAGRRNVRGLRSLFTALVADSGALYDATARARDVGVSRQTIDGWLDLLERTSLIRTLRRWARSARKASRAHPKVYAADPGLVCAFSLSRDPFTDPQVLGRAVETAVLRHLDEAADRWEGRVFFYREGKVEADFVLETSDLTFVIEAAAGRTPHPDKARTVAAVAAKLKDAIPLCVSRLMIRTDHEVSDTVVPEVPLWQFLDALQVQSGPKDLRRWLLGA